MDDLTRKVKELRHIRASDLRPNPRNFRIHPRKQVELVGMSLESYGVARPLLAREDSDGTVHLIDGHLRAYIAGDAVVPVVILDVTSGEADCLMAQVDALSAQAKVDRPRLESLVEDLRAQSRGLEIGETDAVLLAELHGVADELLETSHDQTQYHAVRFTDEQWEVVGRAMEKLSAEEGGEVAAGRCIELICADYLAGPGC